MLDFIPPAAAGLDSAAVPLGDTPPALTANPQPFAQAMDRALASNPKPQPSGAQTLPARPTPEPDRPSTLPQEQLATSTEPAAITRTGAPRSQPRPRESDRQDGTSTADGSVFHSLAAMALVIIPLPQNRTPDAAALPARPSSAQDRPAIGLPLPGRAPVQAQLTLSPEAAGNKPADLVDQLKPPPQTQNSSPTKAPGGNSMESVEGAAAPSGPATRPIDSQTKPALELESISASFQGPAPPQPPGAGPGLRADPSAAASISTGPASPGKEYPSELGTSVAQQEMPMKKAEKMQRNAEPSQQNLPGTSAGTAEHGGARTAPVPSAGSSADTDKLMAFTNAGPTSGPAAAESAPASATNAVAAGDARLSSLERTHDLVAMHALRLSQSGNDSLRVVLEPGGGTRLSLELRFGSAGIEAQALLHRGDFQYLNSHWAELQQRLEPRGVHLARLECSTDASGGNGQFPHSQQQASDDAPTRSAFAEFALNGPMTDMPAPRRARTKTHAGWESWA